MSNPSFRDGWRCVVTCRNMEGEPALHGVIVQADDQQQVEKTAQADALESGYEDVGLVYVNHAAFKDNINWLEVDVVTPSYYGY